MAGEDMGLKVTSVRFSDEDVSRVTSLALGDETFSQTVRRVIREASQRAALPARVTRANPAAAVTARRVLREASQKTASTKREKRK
jgi:hypothetical protein